MNMHFDFADLRLLTHIAELHSLTAGAERSCLSLPAAHSIQMYRLLMLFSISLLLSLHSGSLSITSTE